MSQIRVGLIRCDTHGLWYGPLMAEHDAKKFMRPMDPRKPHTHSWQAGGCHEFFYLNYSNPLQMTVPFVGGFEIARVWDQERSVAEQTAEVFFGKPKVCDSFEQCSDDVDLVLIADCNGDGSDHVELATPGLTKGVPTFVDKPFASTVRDARKMLDLARKHHAPIYSQSILSTEPVLTHFAHRIPEVGQVEFASLQGYGTHYAGLVHTVSAVQHLFGPGIQTVQVFEAPKHNAVYLDYGSRNDPARQPRHGIIINCDVGSRRLTSLAMSIYGSRDDIHTLVLGDWVYPDGTAIIIKLIRQLVLTRETPWLLMERVVETIAVLDAFKHAKQTRQAARVADFL